MGYMVKNLSKALQHLGIINIQDEYGTPWPVFQSGVKLAGFQPLLDPCTNHANAKCKLFCTIDEDALCREWRFDFFMNPPYSRIREFMAYAYNEHVRHNVNGLCLTFAKTDTKWWHRYVEGIAEVHFIEGRIRFLNAEGHPTKHPAPYPSCWIVWRKK